MRAGTRPEKHHARTGAWYRLWGVLSGLTHTSRAHGIIHPPKSGKNRAQPEYNRPSVLPTISKGVVQVTVKGNVCLPWE